MLLIGVHSYILAVAPPEKKTQGIAIIVFGFQGGLISGMALGSLLVNYSQPAGVFIISAAIGFAALFYTMTRLPYVFDESRAADGMAASVAYTTPAPQLCTKLIVPEIACPTGVGVGTGAFPYTGSTPISQSPFRSTDCTAS
mgnify:CR=1 FL=1